MKDLILGCNSLTIVAVMVISASALVTTLAMTAVWSRKPFRRRAAAAILQQILFFLRRPRL